MCEHPTSLLELEQSLIAIRVKFQGTFHIPILTRPFGSSVFDCKLSSHWAPPLALNIGDSDPVNRGSRDLPGTHKVHTNPRQIPKGTPSRNCVPVSCIKSTSLVDHDSKPNSRRRCLKPTSLNATQIVSTYRPFGCKARQAGSRSLIRPLQNLYSCISLLD